MSGKFMIAAAIGAGAFAAAALVGISPLGWFDFRALGLVAAYTGILVLVRFSPGRCLYRVLVLAWPEKHLTLEVAKAREFAVYVGTRILFAGLIFTLVDIAGVLAAADGIIAAAGPLSMALSAALYSLVLYVIVSRAAVAASR